jgi:hypothetical protein
MRLSPHFTLQEGTKSQTALRHGIDNTPDAAQLLAMQLVAERILEPVRREFSFPFSPSSFFRCAELNKLIGGRPGSQHRRGEAVDFEIPGVPNRDLASWIYFNLSFDQLILECHDVDIPSSGWVHVSCKATKNRGESLVYKDGIYRPWVPE